MIHCENIHRSFVTQHDQVDVLKGIDLDIKSGSQMAIMGASGSGKSTLLHILGGLDQPNSGKVIINDVDLFSLSLRQRARWRNRNLGFVYQLHHLLAEFSALENVQIPLLISGMHPSKALKRAMELLEQVQMQGLANRRSAQLSGGEKQRIAVLRAIAMKPECVLADEPTGNLDRSNAQEVLRILRELIKEQGSTLIMITHDADLASKMQSVLTLNDGLLDGGCQKLA